MPVVYRDITPWFHLIFDLFGCPHMFMEFNSAVWELDAKFLRNCTNNLQNFRSLSVPFHIVQFEKMSFLWKVAIPSAIGTVGMGGPPFVSSTPRTDVENNGVAGGFCAVVVISGLLVGHLPYLVVA